MPPLKSMDRQLEEQFKASGHEQAYQRLPSNLMNRSLDCIKDEIKKLSQNVDPTLNRVLLARAEYVRYWRIAQTIKQKSSRKSKTAVDRTKYLPWKRFKEKKKPIRPGANSTQKNKYVREAAKEYHALRNAYLKEISGSDLALPLPFAVSEEIHRFAGLLVAYNGDEIEDTGDGTVRTDAWFLTFLILS